MLKNRDPNYGACRPLFDDMHDGKRIVDVSPLVIGEVVQVIRREAARDVAKEFRGHAPSPEAARYSAGNAVGDFFHQMAGLSDAGRIVTRHPSDNAGHQPVLSMRMVIRHEGNFEPHGKMGLIYRALGILDMMHALVARDYGVQNFCTRDRQFSSLAGDPEFDAINFVIL